MVKERLEALSLFQKNMIRSILQPVAKWKSQIHTDR